MPKLSPLQHDLLAAASKRPGHGILPPVADDFTSATVKRSIRALLRRGLIAEITATIGDASPVSQNTKTHVITGAGLAAIGARGEAPATASQSEAAAVAEAGSSPARPAGKLGLLLDAVGRNAGASLADLAGMTGWLPHTTRAAVARLRKRGYDVRLATIGERKVYRLSGKV